MSNIDIRFEGYANFGQAHREVARLKTQFEQLNAVVQKNAYTDGSSVDAKRFADAQKQVSLMQRTYSNALSSSGQFEVSQRRLKSHTQDYVKDLQRQRVGMRQAIGDLREFTKGQGTLNAVYREQMRLRQMSIASFTTDNAGNPLATIAVPKDTGQNLRNVRAELGLISQVAYSASTEMVNWGKNTQWAGRQLTVGFTVPLAMLAVAMGKSAYDVEKTLTGIAKVYDTQSYDMLSTNDALIAKEQELLQLRSDSLTTARNAASEWGKSGKESLETIEALAATGKTGSDLQGSSSQVLRFSTLGDMDSEKSLQTVITLQSVYKQSVKETAEALDYFNSVENDTSLSMEDISEALPIAAGPLKNIGVDFKELTMLMVAMKERGVTSATEGANALKSAVTRLYNPSQRVLGLFKDLTGQSLGDIQSQSGGDFVTYLKNIGAAIEDLEGPQRAQVLSKLFGTEQSSRLSALLDGLMDGGGQVASVMDVMGRSAEQNAQTAATELERLAASPAMKLKSAFEEIKLTLGESGGAFLEFGAVVLEAGNKFINMIRSLPGPVKTLLVVTAGIAAIAGPFLMLLGLMGNLIGNGLKFASVLSLMVTKQKIVSVDQMAAAKVADMTAKSLGYEAGQTATLAQQMEILTGSLREAATAQLQFNRSQGLPGPAAPLVPHGPERKPVTPRVGTGTASDPLRADSTVLANQKAIANETEKTSRNVGAAAAGTVLMAASAGAMLFPWSDTVNKVGQYALMIGLLAPLMSPIRNAVSQIPVMWANATAKMKEHNTRMGTATGGWRGIAGSAKNAVASIGMMNIGLAAAAVGGFALWQYVKNTAEESKKLNSDVDKLGELFGFSPKEIIPVGEDGAESLENRAKKVQALREEYKTLDSFISSSLSDQEAFERASVMGIRAFDAGATIEQAEDVVKTALEAAGRNAEAIMLEFEFDPADVEQRMTAILSQVQAGINEAANENVLQNIGRQFGADKIGSEATGAAGTSFGQALINAASSDDIEKATEDIATSLKEAKKKITDEEYDTENALAESFVNDLATTLGTNADKMREAIDEYYKDNDIVAEAGNARYLDIDAIMNADIDSNVINQINAAKEEQAQLNLVTKEYDSIVSGLNATQTAAFEALMSGATVSYEQWESIKGIVNETNSSLSETDTVLGAANLSNLKFQLAGANAEAENGNLLAHANAALIQEQIRVQENSLFQNAELNRLASERLSTEGAIVTTKAQQNNLAQQAINDSIDQIVADEARMQSIAQDAYRAGNQALQSGMNDLIDKSFKVGDYAPTGGGGSRKSGGSNDGARKAMDKRNKDRQKAFDKQQKAEKNAFDDRIKAEEAALEAKHKAELDAIDAEDKAREEAAEAEERRIDRLKDRRQSDIDFRVAMASGNLDEAAKIRVNSGAREEEYNLEDSERARDAELEMQRELIKTRQDAEKAALDQKLEMQRENFEAQKELEREAMQESLETQRVNTATSVGITNAGANRKRQIGAQQIKDQLAAELEYIPKSQAEQEEHMRVLAEKYGKYGITLEDIMKIHGENVKNAMTNSLTASMNKIRTEVNWGGMAYSVTDEMVKAVFGKDIKSFLGYVDLWGAKGMGNFGGARHEGGLIGSGSGSRAGYSRSSAKMPSERVLLAKPNEYVVQESAVRALGVDYLDKINSTTASDGTGPDDRHKGVGGAMWNRDVATATIMAPYLAFTRRMGIEAQAREKKAQASMAAGYGLSSYATRASDGNIPTTKAADLDYGGRWGRPWQKRYGRSGPNNLHDFPLPWGTPVYAPHDGVAWGVDYPGYEPEPAHKGRGYRSAGRRMFLQEPGGNTLSFAHLSERRFTDPKQVKGGTVLGYTGETGRAFGPHAHMEWNRQYRFEAEMAKRGVMGLRRGGKLKYDNTLVNTHKGETVLNSRLTNKFERNISDLEGNVSYGDINVILPEGIDTSNMRVLAMEIKREIDKEQGRYGRVKR